jgi:Cof subfamily protein (haloacid dehalogenase superfamily)
VTGREYDALLLDLDGTLLDGQDQIHPENRRALDAARERGVHVMVVTGRSLVSAQPVLDQLDLDTRVVLFNGAAVYCPREERLTEERVLSERALGRLLAHADRSGDLTILMTAKRKVVRADISAEDRRALEGLAGVEFVEPGTPRPEHVIRVTFLSERHGDSALLAAEVEEAAALPLYLTHFPLSVLPRHRESSYLAVDVHAPCRGKAEALRVLGEQHGVPPARVVAVGDATNDIPMVREAGLGVAMGSGMRELQEVADRVIGHHDSAAISELVTELFL